MLRTVVLLACVVAAALGFTGVPLRSLKARSSSSSLRMMAEGEAKPWEGAKKFSMKDREKPVIMTSEQISKILPHRYPFLLVDRVVEFIPGKSAVGIKCITANEPQFTGHFPDRPIMPGVLMIEAMAQLGGIICLSPPISNGDGQKLFFFTGVNGVRWKSPVTPGDDLIMEMNLVSFDERLGFASMTGKAYVGGRVRDDVWELGLCLSISHLFSSPSFITDCGDGRGVHVCAGKINRGAAYRLDW